MGDLPGTVQTVFGIVAMIAGGVASALLVSVRTLRSSIEDRDKRIAGLEGRVDDLEADLATERTSHEGTKRDLESVTKVVTGEAHWVALEEMVGQVLKIVTDIAATVRKVLTKVGAR